MAQTLESAPALDITTESVRRPIRIDGVTYHLNNVDDLTMQEQIKLGKIGKRFESLVDETSIDAMDDAALNELQSAVDWATRRALHDVPEDIIVKLRDGHRIAIVEAFSVGLQTEGEDASQSTNELPASPDSTASTLSES